MIADYRDYFRGKRITSMGLGLLGRGVGDAKFLAESLSADKTGEADLIVTDLKSAKDLASSLKKLRNLPRRQAGYKNIKFVLGQHRIKDFQNRDLIIKAAGVPLDSPYIAEAQKNKIPVVMSAALFTKFAKRLGAKIIGVTGTRGKTTVTQLIYEILARWQGESLTARTHLKIRKVWLGGNVVGISTLALLPKVRSGDLVVLELDSWQLQGFGDLKISPDIAVFTNFMSDHLNYYHGSMEKYFADKANIYKYQQVSDHLFWGGQVPPISKSWKVKLLGEHSLNNIALAIAVAKLLKVPSKIIKTTVENFAGVPGRLELIRVWRGIKIYNDTTATTPDATLAALQALGIPRLCSGQNQNIVLILGGADKNLPLDKLVENLPKYCQTIILLPGTGTERLKLKVQSAKFKEVKNLREAVELGLVIAKRGDILLLSPAFASFGPPPGGFKNEYDRGRQFVKLVRRLR